MHVARPEFIIAHSILVFLNIFCLGGRAREKKNVCREDTQFSEQPGFSARHEPTISEAVCGQQPVAEVLLLQATMFISSQRVRKAQEEVEKLSHLLPSDILLFIYFSSTQST